MRVVMQHLSGFLWRRALILGLALGIFSAPLAQASWSWGVGYHNPVGSLVGVNFLYRWPSWAFEAGIGGINSEAEDSSNPNNELTIYGGVNLKYLFLSGWFRPYLQGGLATGINFNDGSSPVGASLSGGYFGGGLFLDGSSFFVYASYNRASSSDFFQAGVGFPF